MTLMSIFWRTFAALALPYFGVLATVDWLAADWRAPLIALGLGLLTAALGALVAVGWAWQRGPAVSALAKALRAGAEKILAGLATVVFSQVADLMVLGNLLRLLIPAAVVAFVVTYLQYLGAVPAQPATESTPLPSQ